MAQRTFLKKYETPLTEVVPVVLESCMGINTSITNSVNDNDQLSREVILECDDDTEDWRKSQSIWDK